MDVAIYVLSIKSLYIAHEMRVANNEKKMHLNEIRIGLCQISKHKPNQVYRGMRSIKTHTNTDFLTSH